MVVVRACVRACVRVCVRACLVWLQWVLSGGGACGSQWVLSGGCGPGQGDHARGQQKGLSGAWLVVPAGCSAWLVVREGCVVGG